MSSCFARLGPAWRDRADPDWLCGWSPRSLALPGGQTEVVVLGAGPTVVLLPPLPGYKEAWLACAAPLARRFRVVTCDLRTGARGARDWNALLEDLERVLDEVAPGPVALVGHSLGGALAQRYALARPDRVAALVLSSTFARITHPPGEWGARFVEQPLVVASQRLLPARVARGLARRFAAREAWVYDRACDERLLEFVRFCIRDLPLAAARTCLTLALAHDAREAVEAISCPTLVVVGERDTRLARDSAAWLARTIPGATVAVSPGVGHLHPFSGSAWFVEHVGGWLDARLGR